MFDQNTNASKFDGARNCWNVVDSLEQMSLLIERIQETLNERSF